MGTARRRHGPVCGAAVALVLGTAVPAGAAGPSATPGGGSTRDLREPQTSSEGVEVRTYGVTSQPDRWVSGAPEVVHAVHAVQRVGDVTVVYWSLGWDTPPESTGSWSWFGHMPSDVTAYTAVGPAAYVSAVSTADDVLAYAVPLPGAAGATAAASSRVDALSDEVGVMHVLWSVLPALPAGTDEVDVTLGFGRVVTDVDVGEGLLEPVATGPVVPLGTGWPEVPAEVLQPPVTPEMSLRPLVEVVEQVDGTSRETRGTRTVSVDVAADVLFATDSAELSSEAVARVQEVAADVSGRAAPGTVTVVGHTDDQAPDDYNLDLSRRRAQAVADVLGPALDRDDVEVAVDGRGEAEPVADNGSEAGRALNRRVGVGFTETPGGRP